MDLGARVTRGRVAGGVRGSVHVRRPLRPTTGRVTCSSCSPGCSSGGSRAPRCWRSRPWCVALPNPSPPRLPRASPFLPSPAACWGGPCRGGRAPRRGGHGRRATRGRTGKREMDLTSGTHVRSSQQAIIMRCKQFRVGNGDLDLSCIN